MTKTINHAPGPWVESYSLSAAVHSAQSGLVAIVYGVTEAERQRNVALIAAAPDLLAALKAELDWLVFEVNGAAVPSHSGYETLQMIRRAIAKAEGGAA